MAVDWADYIWLRVYRKVDQVFTILVMILVIILGTFIYLYKEVPEFTDMVDQYHKEINIKVKENAKKKK